MSGKGCEQRSGTTLMHPLLPPAAFFFFFFSLAGGHILFLSVHIITAQSGSLILNEEYHACYVMSWWKGALFVFEVTDGRL